MYTTAQREMDEALATLAVFKDEIQLALTVNYITKDAAEQLVDYYALHEADIPKSWYRRFQDYWIWNWTNNWYGAHRSVTNEQRAADIYDCIRVRRVA